MKKVFVAALGCAAVILGLLSVSSVSSAAPDPAPTPVARPTPDFSSMMFLTGTWTCTQNLRGKTRPDTSTTTIGMDGMWMVSQDTAPPFDQYRTYAITTTTYTGYDADLKQWIGIGVGSDGTYYLATSPGWQGNTISWSSKGLDGTTASDVGTKVSDTEMSDAFTVTDPKGKVTNTTIHCTKSGS
jgi:hypothetical protein